MSEQKKFNAQFLTPEGSLYEGEVIGVTVPGSLGSFEMLHNHASIVSSLGIGEIVIEKADGDELYYAVSGGFVEMNNNHLTILAEKAEEASEIDKEEVMKLRKELKEKIKTLREGREEAEVELKLIENRAKVAGI